MLTLIVLGIAITVIMVLFAAVVARSAHRRENRFAAPGELGAMPWIVDAGGVSSDCDAGTGGDAGCGDGGGGGRD
jgi:hypothetical protein